MSRAISRAGLCAFLGSALLFACTFTRSLDYLQDGKGEGTSSGTSGSTTSSSGTTSSSSTSSSGEAGPSTNVALASAQLYPANLAQDSDFLYWSTDGNQIMRVAKAGGEPKELTKLDAADVSAILDLTLDPSPGGNIYVLIQGSIKTVPREGGAAADFVTNTTAVSITADDTYLFAINEDTNFNDTLIRYPKANGTQPTTIGPPPGKTATGFGALKVFGDQVYWTFTDDKSQPVCHQLPKTAPASFGTPTVWKNLGKNSEQAQFGVNALYDYELDIDNEGIYWIDDSEGVPFRLKRGAEQLDTPTLLSANSSPTALTIDASWMYFLTSDKIVKISKADTNLKDIYPLDVDATELLGDDKNLYFIVQGDDVKATGSIQRITK